MYQNIYIDKPKQGKPIVHIWDDVKGYETSVNQLLKENGHAYEYHGEKKKVFNG